MPNGTDRQPRTPAIAQVRAAPPMVSRVSQCRIVAARPRIAGSPVAPVASELLWRLDPFGVFSPGMKNGQTSQIRLTTAVRLTWQSDWGLLNRCFV